MTRRQRAAALALLMALAQFAVLCACAGLHDHACAGECRCPICQCARMGRRLPALPGGPAAYAAPAAENCRRDAVPVSPAVIPLVARKVRMND